MLYTQHIRAVQLSNNWTVRFGEESVDYCALGHHSLDVWALDLLHFWAVDLMECTFFLNNIGGEIEIAFSDNFLPNTVHVRRWPTKFATSVDGDGRNIDLWSQYEIVRGSNNIFRTKNDDIDYIYEVEAIWVQGRSFYTFCINSANE